MNRVIRAIVYPTLFLTMFLVLDRWHPEVAKIISATIAIVTGWLVLCVVGNSAKNPYVSVPSHIIVAVPFLPGYIIVRLLLLVLRLSSRFRRWESQRVLNKMTKDLYAHPYMMALQKEFGTREGPQTINIDDVFIPDPGTKKYEAWLGRRKTARVKKIKKGCKLEDCDSCSLRWILEKPSKDEYALFGPYAWTTNCEEHIRLDMQAYVDKHKATNWEYAKKPPEDDMKRIGVNL